MQRVAVLGNAGGGKSILARALANSEDLPYIEVDALLWQAGWKPVSHAEFAEKHRNAIGQSKWLIDGLGMLETIAPRLSRATDIVFVDMPLWVHFWLAAERQWAWAARKLDNPPAGLVDPPSTARLFESIWEVDVEWMPEIRTLVVEAESRGTRVRRIRSIEELTAYQTSVQKRAARIVRGALK